MSQNYIDLIRVSGQSTPLNKFKDAPSHTRASELTAELIVPLKLNDRNIWFTNLVYERIYVRLFESGGYYALSSLTMRTGLVKNHSDKVTGTYLFVPRISSSAGSALKQSFQFGGLALFKFTKSEQVSFKFGLFASSDFFGRFLTPLIGYYQLSEDGKWEINALLPASFNLNRTVTKRLDLGLNFNGQIKGFHLNQVPGIDEPGYVVRSSNEVSIYCKLKITKNLFAQARTGFSVGRSYRVYDTHDKVDLAISFIKFNDQRSQLNTDFKNGIVGQVGVFYRLPTN